MIEKKQMSINDKYEQTLAECNSLRRQLKQAYSKCSAIFDALSVLDQSATNERQMLERLISDLRQTLEIQFEKNENLAIENLQNQRREKYIRDELNSKTRDLKEIQIQYRRIYVRQQQEKFIRDNLIIRTKKN